MDALKIRKVFHILSISFTINAIINNYYSVDCKNVLWLSGLASPSHQIWTRFLQKTLAGRGLNLTVLTPDEEFGRLVNVTYLYMDGVYKYYDTNSKNLNHMAFNNPINDVIDLANFRTDSCYPALRSKGVKELLDYPNSFKFDLVIHDFAGSQCLLGFVKRFGNPPLIGVSASTCPLGVSAVSGNPMYPGLTPSNHVRVGYNMDFSSRIFNVIIYFIDYLTREFYMAPKQNNLARYFFTNQSNSYDILDIWTIYRSTIFTLVNLTPLDLVQPFFANVIPVGGMHIEEPGALREELNDFVSKSKLGIVYFALGTNIKSEYFTSKQVKCFLDVFKRFPSYRFLWKYDPSQMGQALPENVMISKWMPQNDILGHPATKVFMSHGGALSCHEAMWYGVPQLLLPFIIDQKHNSAKAAERGIAIVLNKDKLNTDVIVNALEELLHNKSYIENMRRISDTFRDQPQSPLERAVFWIEYAIRHGKRCKLRFPGQDMGILQQMAFDVILFVFFTTLSIVYFLYYFCFRYFSRKLYIIFNFKQKTN